MFQRTIPLPEIRISGAKRLDAAHLPAGAANERIQELYAFLGVDVTVAVQGGVATIRADAAGELDRRGQR